MRVLGYKVSHTKKTPYGSIKVYAGMGFHFVLTDDVFDLAHVYAKQEGWDAKKIKGIGTTYPF